MEKRKRGRPTSLNKTELKSKITSMRLTNSTSNELKDLARRKGWSKSDVIAQAVHEYYIRSCHESSVRMKGASNGSFVFDKPFRGIDD